VCLSTRSVSAANVIRKGIDIFSEEHVACSHVSLIMAVIYINHFRVHALWAFIMCSDTILLSALFAIFVFTHGFSTFVTFLSISLNAC
jgi:hypothetical protein